MPAKYTVKLFVEYTSRIYEYESGNYVGELTVGLIADSEMGAVAAAARGIDDDAFVVVDAAVLSKTELTEGELAALKVG